MRHVLETDSCWLWTGGKLGQGNRYGGFRVGTRPKDPKRYAHRVSHELFIGPIPEGMHVDHVKERGCSSTLCVNPDHLEAVLPLINWQRQRMSVCPRGHDMSDPRNVTIDKKGRRRGCAECRRGEARRRYYAQKED